METAKRIIVVSKLFKGFIILSLFGFFVFILAGFIIPANIIMVDNNSQASSSQALDNSQSTQNSQANNNFFQENIEDSKITLYAVGDIMLDRGVKYNIDKYSDKDYKFPFLSIADYLKKADIVFGNLESQISDKGKKIGTVNSFRVDPSAVEGLKYAGFNIVSVANNHAFDYDIPALEDSLNRLKSANITYVGGGFNEDEAFSLKTMEIKGTKIGFLAYCGIGSQWWRALKDRTGIAFVTQKDIKEVKQRVKEAKEKVDILIVSFHLGTEYDTNPDSSETYFYRSCIEAGADLVIGHHPHVAQPIEGYMSKWIAYSLGNFVFDQGFSENTMKGLLLEVSINNKKIEDVEGKDIKMNKYFQPELVLEEE